MKRRVLAAITAAIMLMAAVPVMAAEESEDDTAVTGEQDLTNLQNAGDTTVEADILGVDTGDVSYIIAIPEKIDFGTLQMPSDDTVAHLKKVDFEVSAVEINGLDTTTQRVAVLMHDKNTTNEIFKIMGSSGTNNSKVLKYNVLSSAGVDITSGTAYTNGYLFAAFSAAGQSISGTLSLEQNQLLDGTDITSWAGDYLGTINFYTAIASLGEYQ